VAYQTSLLRNLSISKTLQICNFL